MKPRHTILAIIAFLLFFMLVITIVEAADLTPTAAIAQLRAFFPGLTVGVAELKIDGQTLLDRCAVVKNGDHSYIFVSCVTGPYTAAIAKLPEYKPPSISPYDLIIASHFRCTTDPTKTQPLGVAEIAMLGSGRTATLPVAPAPLRDCEDRLAKFVSDIRAVQPLLVDTVLKGNGLTRIP